MTKLEIFFERDGITLAVAAHLVANHNEGKEVLLMSELKCYLRLQKTVAPSALKNLRVDLSEDGGKINVYEDGVNVTYVIEESNVIQWNDELKNNPVYERNNH